MKKYLALLCSTLFLLSGCGNKKDSLVIIHTEFGDMKVLLYEETPLHKKNFLELARSGAYDSTLWHRVIEGFMIQGGDIYAKDGGREPQDDRIPAEIVKGFYHTKGALAAARQPDQVNPEKMSSGAQFYIVQGRPFTENELTVDQMKLNQGIMQLLSDTVRFDTLRQQFVILQEQGDYAGINKLVLNNIDLVEKELNINVRKSVDPETLKRYTAEGGAPHLDNEYTVFGRVVEGLEVIDKIAAVQTARGDKPVKDIYLTMEVEEVPKKEITERYGYEYPEAEK